MARRLLIVQTLEREGPALLRTLAEQRGWQVDLRRLWLGDPLPRPRTGEAVVLLGGPASANDGAADGDGRMPGLVRFAADLLERRQPVLGICLGLQVLVKAGGGEVVPSSVPELGWRDPEGRPWWLQVTAAGRRSPWLAGLPDRLALFQLHGEEVRPTGTMAVLLEGAWCRPQMVQVGPRAVGIQGHVELDGASHRRWFAEDPDLRSLPDRAEQERIGTEELRVLRPLGERLLSNWLDQAV
jgi:GMP synthase-like glutamine amidotransferase